MSLYTDYFLSKEAGGRRQEAEGANSEGDSTPPELKPLNESERGGLKPLLPLVAAGGTEHSIPPASCPVPPAFFDNQIRFK